MTQAEISGISPFFIVSHVPSSLSFYRDRLGFEITFQGPAPDDIFFGIVRRGGAQILFKDVGVPPLPNYKRDVKKGIARWDAFVDVPDPDALAAEFASRDVEFSEPLKDTDDVVSSSRTPTAMSCFSVVLGDECQSKWAT
jgi:hypothetical protein